MKFYYVDDGGDASYCTTLAEARTYARHIAGREGNRQDCNVTQVDVPTDKDNILRLINSQGGHTIFGKIVFTAKAKKDH